MPPFWTIFTPSDYRYSIVFWLAGLAVGCSESITSVFCFFTVKIHLIAVTTFFNETCKSIFNYLLKARFSNSGLSGLVLVYFRTIETNSRGMLHLHYLVWLKEMSSFFDFHKRIIDKDRFKTCLLSFLDQVIRCELILVDINQVLPKVGSSASAIENAFVFTLQFQNDVNLVAFQVQMHS